jgi:hypothetical protein
VAVYDQTGDVNSITLTCTNPPSGYSGSYLVVDGDASCGLFGVKRTDAGGSNITNSVNRVRYQKPSKTVTYSCSSGSSSLIYARVTCCPV